MNTQAPANPPEITVLIVNDSDRFIQALNEFLTEQLRLKVIGAAKGGDEAIQLIQQQGAPRVILIDLNMPDRSGLQVIPVLRDIVPDACIILLTSETEPRIKRAALTAGANDFISKDRVTDELVPAIMRCSAA